MDGVALRPVDHGHLAADHRRFGLLRLLPAAALVNNVVDSGGILQGQPLLPTGARRPQEHRTAFAQGVRSTNQGPESLPSSRDLQQNMRSRVPRPASPSTIPTSGSMGSEQASSWEGNGSSRRRFEAWPRYRELHDCGLARKLSHGTGCMLLTSCTQTSTTCEPLFAQFECWCSSSRETFPCT